MNPFQAGRATPNIFHRWPTQQRNFGRSERLVALVEAGRRKFPISKIPVHGPLRPSRAQLAVKPSSRVDDFDPTIDSDNAFEHRVRQPRDEQYFDVYSDRTAIDPSGLIFPYNLAILGAQRRVGVRAQYSF